VPLRARSCVANLPLAASEREAGNALGLADCQEHGRSGLDHRVLVCVGRYGLADRTQAGLTAEAMWPWFRFWLE
jgi:hypothetical protein